MQAAGRACKLSAFIFIRTYAAARRLRASLVTVD